jgi:hypothetical protein
MVQGKQHNPLVRVRLTKNKTKQQTDVNHIGRFTAVSGVATGDWGTRPPKHQFFEVIEIR